MAYIGKPFLNVPVNTFAKEDFVGSDTGTNNSIANSLVLSREIPGLNASNVEVFVNNIRQEPDVAYFIKDDANGCLLYTSPSPRDGLLSRMPSSA